MCFSDRRFVLEESEEHIDRFLRVLRIQSYFLEPEKSGVCSYDPKDKHLCALMDFEPF